MHSDNQHFLIIGTIENADPATFRQTAGRAPEKIMFQLLGAWLFEVENLAALGINPRHHMPNGAILAGSIHALKYQQQRGFIRCIMQILQ